MPVVRPENKKTVFDGFKFPAKAGVRCFAVRGVQRRLRVCGRVHAP
jgi:hypothetical protein